MAKAILAKRASEASQIEVAFRRALGRHPTDGEKDDVKQFFSETDETAELRLTHLCLSLFNCNEFVTVD